MIRSVLEDLRCILESTFRESSWLVPINEDGEVLVLLRSKEVEHPLTWGLIGGSVEPGETSEEALEREVREEVGFKRRDYKIKKKLKIGTITAYIAEVPHLKSKGAVDINTNPEHSGIGYWLNPRKRPPNLHPVAEIVISNLS